MKKQLPKGWIIKQLGGKHGVADIVNGATPSTDEPSYWNGDIPWATPTDVGKLRSMYITETERRITKEGYESCSTTLVPANSILMTSRAPVGNIAINTVPMCTNQGFKSIIPKEGVDVMFLFFYLQSIVVQIQKDSHGNTFTEIGKEKVEKIEVFIPEKIEDQKLVASKILKKYETYSKLLNASKQQLDAVEALPTALLREVFGFNNEK